jgi:hypothetical protein
MVEEREGVGIVGAEVGAGVVEVGLKFWRYSYKS